MKNPCEILLFKKMPDLLFRLASQKRRGDFFHRNRQLRRPLFYSRQSVVPGHADHGRFRHHDKNPPAFLLFRNENAFRPPADDQTAVTALFERLPQSGPAHSEGFREITLRRDRCLRRIVAAKTFDPRNQLLVDRGSALLIDFQIMINHHNTTSDH